MCLVETGSLVTRATRNRISQLRGSRRRRNEKMGKDERRVRSSRRKLSRKRAIKVLWVKKEDLTWKLTR